MPIPVACGGNKEEKAPASTAIATRIATPTPIHMSTPTTTPTVPGSRIDADTAHLAALEDVVLVIEGIVENKEGTLTGEFSPRLNLNEEEKRQRACYSDWSIKVVRYLVDPFPYERITLRKIDGSIIEDGTVLPHGFPYELSKGERAIFFLTKKAWDPSEDDQFTCG